MTGPMAGAKESMPVPEQAPKARPRDAKSESLLVTVREGIASPGQPLDSATRGFFESRLGHSFAGVKVHDDIIAAESARKLDADAYSVGNELVFANGRFRPGTKSGDLLLAHELVHTVQQKTFEVQDVDVGLSDNSDAIESEASGVALRAMSGTVSAISSRPPDGMLVVARQQATTMQQINPEGQTTDPIESMVNAIESDLQKDPGDGSGNVRRRIEFLGSPARQNVIERLQHRLSPSQNTQLSTILSSLAGQDDTSGARQKTPKSPQEMAASVRDRSAIQEEVSSEAMGPNVTARFTDGGPVVLLPTREPEPPRPAQPVAASTVHPVERATEQQPMTRKVSPLQASIAYEPPLEPEATGTAHGTEVNEQAEQPGAAEPAPVALQDIGTRGSPGGLQAEVEQDKAVLVQDAAALKTSIAGTRESEIAKTREATSRQIAQVQSHFATRRRNITSQVDQQKSTLRSQTLQHEAQLESESSSRTIEFQTQMLQKRTDMTSFVQEQSLRPRAMVEDEIIRAKGELDTAAAESSQAGRDEAARHPGSEDPAPDQREAAREVGLDSANDIRVKKPAIANDLGSRLEGFSGEYSQYAETVNSRILETENVIVPALGEMAGRSSGTLKEGEAAALQAIENRASADLQSLNLLESAAVSSLRAASKTTIRQIRNTSRLAQEQVDVAITAMASEIDNIASGAGMAAEPAEPGVAPTGEGQSSVQESPVAVAESVAVPDPLSQAMEAEKSFVQESRNSLHEAVATVNGLLPMLTSSFSTGSSESVRTSRSGADAIYQRLMPAINNLVMAGNQQDQSIIDSTLVQQESLTTSAASEVDSAEGQARGEVTGMNDTFHDELREGANESIREAIKPRTDRVEDRAAEAAEKAGESWYVGLFRAIGEIVVGLVILVVVALVVAAIAALFGVVLGVWGAIMIAGGILLAAGLIMSLVTRSQQQEFRDAGLGTQILVVAGDTLGLTNLVEGVSGREVLTGRTLSASEQTRRATLGVFSAVMLALGARGSIRGAPRGPAAGAPRAAPRAGWVPEVILGGRTGPAPPRSGRAGWVPEVIQGGRGGGATPTTPPRTSAPTTGTSAPPRGSSTGWTPEIISGGRSAVPAPRTPGISSPPRTAASGSAPRAGARAGPDAFDGSAARVLEPLPAEPLPVQTPPPVPSPRPVQVPIPLRPVPLVGGAGAAAAPNIAGNILNPTETPAPTPTPTPVPQPQPAPEPDEDQPPVEIRLVLPAQKSVHATRYSALVNARRLRHSINYERDRNAQAGAWDRALRPGGPMAIYQEIWNAFEDMDIAENRRTRPNWSRDQDRIPMEVDHIVELQVLPDADIDAWGDTFSNYELLDRPSNGSAGPQLRANIAAERRRLVQTTGDPAWLVRDLFFTIVRTMGGNRGQRWLAEDIQEGEHYWALRRLRGEDVDH